MRIVIFDSLCCLTGRTSLVSPRWRRQDDLTSLCIKNSEYCGVGVGKVTVFAQCGNPGEEKPRVYLLVSVVINKCTSMLTQSLEFVRRFFT